MPKSQPVALSCWASAEYLWVGGVITPPMRAPNVRGAAFQNRWSSDSVGPALRVVPVR